MKNKNINLDILHNVPLILDSKGSYGRQIGKTTYCLYTILGTLEVLENKTILVLFETDKRILDRYKDLIKFFAENGLTCSPNISMRRISFLNNTNHLKFISKESLLRNHPTDFIGYGDENIYIITDLENMPPEFYQEELTPNNIEILNKYFK